MRCDCGKEKVVIVNNLRSGHTQSCGCYRRLQAQEANTTHGMAKSRLYNIWCHVIHRCTNPKDHSYQQYGGRGVIVCAEWLDFKSFQEWAEGAGYDDHLTIDRIDNEKGYCPENCRFVTRIVQNQNRRRFSNNTSGYIGVSMKKSKGLYQARTCRDGRQVFLGYFSDPIEAAKARDAFVSKHYESPTLNF